MRRSAVAFVLVAACTHPRPAPPPALRLDRVVLFQNGIGHFERRGALPDRHLRLVLRPHEVDDVIKTLTVIDRDGKAQQVAAVLPTPDQTQGDRVVVDIELSRPVRDLIVSYAVPTAAWKTTYRVAMPERVGGPLLFQAWAMIDNVSEEGWDQVSLSLATGAPLSFSTDLRTPHFVPRPDATGAMVAPTATAVVASSQTRGDLDEDHDGIADRDDHCPNEPEAMNGFEDDDGCPDRGRVLLTSTSIEILDRVFFVVDGATPPPAATPLLDAVAATLRGNPDIRAVEIAGHATAGEDDPWGLSARRAAAVRSALVSRGVQQQLPIRPFGDTLPIDKRPEQNRRVEFQILDRDATTPGRRRAPPPRATISARSPPPPRPAAPPSRSPAPRAGSSPIASRCRAARRRWCRCCRARSPARRCCCSAPSRARRARRATRTARRGWRCPPSSPSSPARSRCSPRAASPARVC
jgi:outer membrane protein OmpA-like peptidoglycan-associated protein